MFAFATRKITTTKLDFKLSNAKRQWTSPGNARAFWGRADIQPHRWNVRAPVFNQSYRLNIPFVLCLTRGKHAFQCQNEHIYNNNSKYD